MRVKRDFIGMFDVAKGMLMIFVLLVHHISFLQLCVLSGTVQGFRPNDLVPIGLFFVIAGYNFCPRKNLKSYFKKQARQFLIPYFLVMIVVIVGNCLLALAAGTLRIQTVSPIILGFLYGSIQPFEMPHMAWVGGVVAMWFLPTMFWAMLFHQLLYKLQRTWVRECCIWGLTALAVTFPDVHRVQVPWFLVQSCAALGFLETGHLLKTYKLLYRKAHLVMILLAVAAWVVVYIYSKVNVASNVWEHWMADYVVGVFVASVLLWLYLRIGVATAPGTQLLSHIGRNSMLFLCVHGAELLIVPWDESMGMHLAAMGLPKGVIIWGSFLFRLAADLVLAALIARTMAFWRRKKLEGGAT